jgi:purine-nucleoside phosphorylase
VQILNQYEARGNAHLQVNPDPIMKSPAALRLAAAKLRNLSPLRPRLALVLGTGFNQTLADLDVDAQADYEKIPGFPSVGIMGHAGKLVIGRLAGLPIMVLCGRSHFYEGYPLSTVTFPIRALWDYGVQDLLLTNAAGAINPKFRVGDFMVLKDHINFMGMNPLRGEEVANLPRFVDLSQVYDRALASLLRRAGASCGLRLRTGVYLAVSGPSYETPAEIRAFRKLGADAVGMSTVPEAITARQCGLRVVAVSCITNRAAGLNRSPLSHCEVLENARRVNGTAGELLSRFAALYGLLGKNSD